MPTSFTHKILQAEILPPESAWDKIAAELDKLEHPLFVNKVAGASIEPPASVWDKVADAINDTPASRKIPLSTRWLKWTAAAIVAGLIIFSATFLFNSGNTPPALSDNETVSKKENSASPSTNSTSDNNSATTDTLSAHPSIGVKSLSSEGQSSSKKSIAGTGRKPEPPVRHALIETSSAENGVSQPTETEDKVSSNVSTSTPNYIPAPDYFVVTAPNGERVKISSKFSEAVASLVGGDNVDYLWKNRFDSWKSKLMTSPSFIPSAGNFLDIAELKDLLKEQ
jgi:hypothetical protein